MHINKIAKAVFITSGLGKTAIVAGGFALLGGPAANGLAVAVPNDLSRPSPKRIAGGALTAVLWYLVLWTFSEAEKARDLSASIDQARKEVQGLDLSVILNPDEKLELARNTNGRFTQDV